MRSDVEAAEELQRSYRALREEIGRVIVGQEEVVEGIIIALIARGHCLLVGVPGLAKTLLVQTVAETLDLSFNRVQFTPDLMPSDITGTEVIQENRSTGEKEFRFVPGPVFANVVLADEINRTPPKTQAALLESMQEHHVTVGGETRSLPEPFFVLATQNPIEQEGTYPLPEAQLDRFMFNLFVDYPSQEEEIEIVRRTTIGEKVEPKSVVKIEDLMEAQELARRVPVPENLLEYAVQLVGRTRPGSETAPDYVREYVGYGAGPRASQYLILGAKTRALLQGRFTPEMEDLKAVALPVLRHRILTNFNAEADRINAAEIVSRLTTRN